MAENVGANSNTMVAGHEVEAVPVPPRYWWLKRILAGSGLLLVGLLALRLWWGWYADRLLHAEIERIVAAGEPIYPEDFDPKEPVPDDQNAANLYLQAANSIVLTTADGVSLETYWNDHTRIAKDRGAVANLIDANAMVLENVRLARRRSATFWPWSVSVASLTSRSNAGWWGQQRQVARVLFVAANAEFQQGDFADGVELLHDIVAFGDAVCDHPQIIDNLVGWPITGLSFMLISEFGSEITVGFGATGGMDIPASRSNVMSLIARLWDDRGPRKSYERALLGERAVGIDGLASPTGSLPVCGFGVCTGIQVIDSTLQFLYSPVNRLEMIEWIELQGCMVGAATDSDWSNVNERVSTYFSTKTQEHWFSNRIANSVGWSNEERVWLQLRIFFRQLASRRMAATALAIRLYQIDHGERPKDLAFLVPNYLPSLPIDLFSPERRMFRMKLEGDDPKLYSVDVDGMDNGGSINLKAVRKLDRSRSDIPFNLEPKDVETHQTKSPASTVSEQTGHNESDVEDDGGKDDETESQEKRPE